SNEQQDNTMIKSCTIKVINESRFNPHWLKKLTGYWCRGEIKDDHMRHAMKYLSSSKKIVLPQDDQSDTSLDKTSLCLWTESKVPDSQVTKLFVHLAR